MPEDQARFTPAGFAAIDGAALPTSAASPAALQAANAALQREVHELRYALIAARIFGVTAKLETTPAVAGQAAILARWIDHGCRALPFFTEFGEQQMRHIPAELRP